jgi:hypothetical protein
MKTKISTFLTVAGAIVVLLASVVELTLERKLKDMSNDALRSRLEEKVDAIWHLMAQQYSQNPENKTGPWEHSNFKNLSDSFWHQKDFGDLEAQLGWIESFRIFSQLAGSVMILIGTGGKKETA